MKFILGERFLKQDITVVNKVMKIEGTNIFQRSSSL
jgi:hypothetical protein